MRLAILAVLVAGSVAAAEPDTVTFTRAEIEVLEARVNQILQQREDAAFKRGQADARERCASLI